MALGDVVVGDVVVGDVVVGDVCAVCYVVVVAVLSVGDGDEVGINILVNWSSAWK